MVAKWAAGIIRSPRDDRIENILPSDQRFLVHRESFRFHPFERE